MAAVKAVLTFGNGEKKVFCEPSHAGSTAGLKSTHTLILKIQKDVNDALTELINAEKAAGSQLTDVADTTDQNQDEDDEDEDEDEDENDTILRNVAEHNDSEPLSKKLKS